MNDWETVNKATHRIWDCQRLIQLFVKPLPNDPQYVEKHKEYLKLEQDLDDAVKHYFEVTGKGKLTVKGRYFHD